jgi:hypothetical protein
MPPAAARDMFSPVDTLHWFPLLVPHRGAAPHVPSTPSTAYIPRLLAAAPWQLRLPFRGLTNRWTAAMRDLTPPVPVVPRVTKCSYGRCLRSPRATALSLRLPTVLWQASARSIRVDQAAIAPSRAVPAAGYHRHIPPTTAHFLAPPPFVPVLRARNQMPIFPPRSPDLRCYSCA